MKKWLVALGVLVLIAVGSGTYYMQTRYFGLGLPWVTAVTLPQFPDFPTPATALAATQSGTLYFSTKSPYDFARLLKGYAALPAHSGVGHLSLPSGADADNPVPAIIMLPGSGGINKGREPGYVKLFNDRGIATFVLDYYAPRGVQEKDVYLRKILAATETDVLVDAFSALKLLATHPAIKAEKIGLTGYSYGGMVTRYALDPRVKAIVAPEAPRFALHMDIYGPCHQTLGGPTASGIASGRAAYLAIYGDSDNSVDPQACREVQAQIETNGSYVESYVLEGAAHAWESDREKKLYDSPYVRGCRFSYDPESGNPLVDGAPLAVSPAGATRGERAYTRASVFAEIPHCIHEGYVMGRDPEIDKKAKAIMVDFLVRHGFVEQGPRNEATE